MYSGLVLQTKFFFSNIAIIFVLDAANESQFSEAKEVIVQVSQNLKDIPLLVYANKKVCVLVWWSQTWKEQQYSCTLLILLKILYTQGCMRLYSRHRLN